MNTPTVRWVDEGDDDVCEVNSGHGLGFRRWVIPADGMMVETDERIIYLPWAMVVEARRNRPRKKST